MRERRTGDSFCTRRSWRPVKRTYFLCGSAPSQVAYGCEQENLKKEMQGKRTLRGRGINVPESLGLHKVNYLTVGEGP
jgi:hypothetical protein